MRSASDGVPLGCATGYPVTVDPRLLAMARTSSVSSTYKLCIKNEEGQAAEVVTVKVAEEDRADRVWIDIKPANSNH
jgi:hypothetical protein